MGENRVESVVWEREFLGKGGQGLALPLGKLGTVEFGVVGDVGVIEFGVDRDDFDAVFGGGSGEFFVFA